MTQSEDGPPKNRIDDVLDGKSAACVKVVVGELGLVNDEQQCQPAPWKALHEVEEQYHPCAGTSKETNGLSVVGTSRLYHELCVDGVAGVRSKYIVHTA